MKRHSQDEAIEHVRVLQGGRLHVKAERGPVALVGPLKVPDEEVEDKGRVCVVETGQASAEVGARMSVVVFQIENGHLPDPRERAVNARLDVAVLKSHRSVIVTAQSGAQSFQEN